MIRNANEPIPSTGKTRKRQQRELPVEHDQDRRRADQRQRRAEQRHDPVGDELVERLHVVGQPRDDHARLAPREEGDRERLQVREQLDPQVLQHALADPADEVGLRVGGRPVDERGDDEADDDEVERAQVAAARCRRRSPAWPAAAGPATPPCRRSARGTSAPCARGRAAPARAARAACARARGRAPAADEVVAPRAHRPSSASTGLRVRKTWSGSPFAAISA